MADQKLKFAISSAFDGEGFKACTDALRQNQKELNSAKAGLGEVTKAFSQISPAAGAAVGGVQKFVGAFATGGIVGGVIQLALQGVAAGIGALVEKCKEAGEAAAKYAGILRTDLVESMKQAQDGFSETAKAASEANKEITDTVKLLNGDVDIQLKNEIHRLHVDTLQKLTGEMEESAKELINIDASYKENMLKANAAIEKVKNEHNAAAEVFANARKKREAAEAAATSAGDAYAALQRQCSGYLQERARIEAHLANLEQAYADGRISTVEIEKNRKAFALKLAELEEEHKDEVVKLKESEKVLSAAQQASADALKDEQTAHDGVVTSMKKREEAELAITEIEEQHAYDLNEYYKKFRGEAPTGNGGGNPDGGKKTPDKGDKDPLDEIKKDVDAMEKDQFKDGGNTKPDYSISWPSTLRSDSGQFKVPSIQDIRDHRLQLMQDQKELKDSANREYGRWVSQMQKDIAEHGFKKTMESGKYDDLLDGLRQLPDDVAAGLFVDSSKKLMLREDWQDYFGDAGQMKKLMDTIPNVESDTNPAKDIKTDVKTIKDDLKKALQVQ